MRLARSEAWIGGDGAQEREVRHQSQHSVAVQCLPQPLDRAGAIGPMHAELSDQRVIVDRYFVAAYEPLLEADSDIVSIHLGPGLSGTLESARQAREQLSERGIDERRILRPGLARRLRRR